jgi:beta-glucosidase
VCFLAFGDRVKHWITINEPWSFSSIGYDLGVFAPGRCSSYIGNCSVGNSATEPYIVGHNMLLAHAAAVDIYKRKYQKLQKGSIGIALVALWIVPYSESIIDKRATERAMDFIFGCAGLWIH